jgi:5-hydroxyisourate hydrolase
MPASLSSITTHILDTARRLPAADIPVPLERYEAWLWRQQAQGETHGDGWLLDWWPAEQLEATEDFGFVFKSPTLWKPTLARRCSTRQIQADFRMVAGQTRYSLPLLLSPYGYTTYRGS